MTQAEIGRRIGFERKSVSAWINGDYAPNVLALARLCKLFRVSADYLLFGEEDKKEIVMLLKHLLRATRAGEDIEQMELIDNEEKIRITFSNQCIKDVNIAMDSGIAIIMDVAKALS